jgi:NADP-dependent 3-hydroxy acid dehydrogenase YdfG
MKKEMGEKARPGKPQSQDKSTGISRRDFLKTPAAAGISLLALNALVLKASANEDPNVPADLGPILEPDDPVPPRKGLGIVIVGASSGMGAEMARQYADNEAFIVLAARREDRLNEVAEEVNKRGGVAHVIPTDVRNEQECIDLILEAISWLDSQGKVIDILALAPVRAQGCAFGQDMSTEVWRNVIETSYFGPAYCLKHALSHLKTNESTLFYFNSIASSIVFPLVFAYTTSKHAWRAIMNTIKFEHPELTVVSSQFNAVDTETWDKELTCFNNDKRYCPSTTRTYLIPTEQMYPEPLAVEKAIRAIETQTPDAYLSLLNKAASLVAFTRHDLGWFLARLEHVMGYELVQQLESEIRQRFSRPGAAGYIARLLQKIYHDEPANELTDAAGSLHSVDRGVSLYLLALDDLLDDAVLVMTRDVVKSHRESVADGSLQRLFLALSEGTLTPPGIADDDDGLAPIEDCEPAPLPPGS